MIWYCTAGQNMTRAMRKRRGLRVDEVPAPRRASREECWPYGMPALKDGETISPHTSCGYADPLGRVLPFALDLKNNKWLTS